MVRKSNAGSLHDAASTRGRRRDRQRGAILRAAARLFRDRGFADTGMRDIAAAADISAANVYHYFSGKDELLFYCQDSALDRMLETVAAARRAESTAAGRLRVILAAHVRTVLDDVEGAAAHLHTESLPPKLRTALVRKRDRYEQALRLVVADGIRRGELVDIDPAIVTRAMLGAVNWTVTWFRPDGARSADAVGDVMAGFLVRGVAIRTPAARRSLTVVRAEASKEARS